MLRSVTRLAAQCRTIQRPLTHRHQQLLPRILLTASSFNIADHRHRFSTAASTPYGVATTTSVCNVVDRGASSGLIHVRTSSKAFVSKGSMARKMKTELLKVRTCIIDFEARNYCHCSWIDYRSWSMVAVAKSTIAKGASTQAWSERSCSAYTLSHICHNPCHDSGSSYHRRIEGLDSLGLPSTYCYL
jgi:hypothetical protein